MQPGLCCFFHGGGLLRFSCCLLLQKLHSVATPHWKHPGNRKFYSSPDGCRNKPGPQATAEIACAWQQNQGFAHAEHFVTASTPLQSAAAPMEGRMGLFSPWEMGKAVQEGQWCDQNHAKNLCRSTALKACILGQVTQDIIPVPPALRPPNSWLRWSLWQPKCSRLSRIESPWAANWSGTFQISDGDGFHRLYWHALVSLRGLFLSCRLELVTDSISGSSLYPLTHSHRAIKPESFKKKGSQVSPVSL